MEGISLTDLKPLQPAAGIDVSELEPIKPKPTALDYAKGAGEAALQLGSGLVSWIPEGIANVAELPFIAADMAMGKEPKFQAGENVRNAINYEPKTELGKEIAAPFLYPFEKLAEAQKYLGEKAFDVAGPVAGAAVETAVASLPFVAVPFLKRGVSGLAKRRAASTMEAIAKAEELPANTPQETTIKTEALKAANTLQKRTAVTPTEMVASGTAQGLRQKAIDKKAAEEIVKKQNLQTKATDDMIKGHEESGNLIIETEPVSDILTDVTEQTFITNKVKELGSVEAVEKLYSDPSAKVDIYARDLAKKMYEEGKVEAPSVQKLNEGQAPLSYEELLALNKKGYKVLTDTPTPSVTDLAKLGPEDLEKPQTLRKQVIDSKTPEEWRRLLTEEPIAPTEAELAMAQKVYDKVQQDGNQLKQKRLDLATLKENGYSDKEISALSQGQIEQRARVLRGEETDVAVTPDKLAKLTPLEAELRELSDLVASKGMDSLTPEELTRVEAVYDKILDADVPELTHVLERPHPFDLVNEDGTPKYTWGDYKRIVNGLRKNAKDRERAAKEPPTEKVVRATNRLRKQVDKVVEAEEGTRTEYRNDKGEFDLEAFNKENPEEPQALNFDEFQLKLKKRDVASEVAKIQTEATIRDKRILTNQEARNLRVNAYKYMPKTKVEAEAWLQTLEKAENLAASGIQPTRMAFSLKEVAKAERAGDITKTQASLIRTVIRTLKEQPDFDLRLAKDLGADRAGLYAFAHNILAIKNPKVIAHEVMHYGFHSVLTKADRLEYYKRFIEAAYDEKGNLDTKRIEAMTSDTRNAYNPSEVFASRGSDYLNEHILTAAERSIFQRVMLWFKDLARSFKQRDFSDVSDLFDRVLSKDSRLKLPEEEIVTGKMPEDLGAIDMSGLKTLSDRVSEIVKVFTQAHKQTGGQRILAELQGQDWGIPWDTTRAVFAPSKDQGVILRTVNMLRNPFRSPYKVVEGTKNERHVYNTNVAEMYWTHMAGQHAIDIRKAEHGGTTHRMSDAEQIRVTQYMRDTMEGKASSIQLTPVEAESVRLTREWLDTMRSRYKAYLMGEWKANLNKTEYGALLDLVSGKTPEETALRYKRIDLDTVQEIAKKYTEIDNWGIDNYIPNVETGRFKILADATTTDGKAYKKLIGVGLSEKDATRKAVAYLEKNPNTTNLYIDTDFKRVVDDSTRITQKQYGAIIGGLAKKIEESITGIDKAVAKQMALKAVQKKFKITPTDSFSEFTMPKQDVLQGEENIFPVLHRYAYSIEKKMALDPVIDQVRRDLPKMNRQEREFILDYLDDVKGRYGTLDKVVDEALGTYKGYSRLVGKARTVEASLKLGYRPVAAGINLASGQLHTMIKVGTKHYAEGIRFLRTPEGEAFIRSIEPYLGTSIVEAGTTIKPKTSMLHPLGMFQRPEPLNREVAVAANYLKARAEGKTVEAAREYAIRANMVQQFTYNTASLPSAMRGPTGKLLMQFKPYLLKELEFMGTLSAKEWVGYMGMQLALGGPRGYLMIMKSLPILASLGFWQEFGDNAEEWMNKNFPLASRGLGALPGLIKPEWGMDISAPSTFQFPTETTDFLGPLVSDLVNLNKDVIVPMSTYGPYKDDVKKVMKPAVILKYWSQVLDYALSKDNWLKDQKGNKLYEVPSAIPYILQSLAGVENVDINRLKSEEGILARRDVRIGGLSTRITNEAMKLILDGKAIPEELMQRMMKNGVTGETIINRVNRSQLPPDLRHLLITEIRRRPEIIEMYPSTQDFD